MVGKAKAKGGYITPSMALELKTLINQRLTMSVIEITARNVPQAYVEGFWKLRTFGKSEDTRNGEVIAMPQPTMLTIQNPEERVLTCPVRDANPFFHVMEFVWMMAGSNDAHWISQFNKRMMDYADDGHLRGAYGWRWANPSPQLLDTVALLRDSPTTRQAVLSMWDPVYDGSRATNSDRPCNTTIYFKIRGSTHLDMLVCNRSNDYVWGMMGANAVHMTLLHELIAKASGYELGIYRVMSNNLHIYTGMPRFDEIYKTVTPVDCYRGPKKCEPFPILSFPDELELFIAECKDFLKKDRDFVCEWLQHVAYPMQMAYLDRLNRDEWITRIAAEDWRLAASEWNERRLNNSSKKST